MKKLKIGNIVRAVFLGTPEPCEVIEVMDKHLYKLRMKSGTILPGVTWYKKLSAKEKKSKPWYIEALINDTTNVKFQNLDVMNDSQLERAFYSEYKVLKEASDMTSDFIS
jgi:hypothetical protein